MMFIKYCSSNGVRKGAIEAARNTHGIEKGQSIGAWNMIMTIRNGENELKGNLKEESLDIT